MNPRLNSCVCCLVSRFDFNPLYLNVLFLYGIGFILFSRLLWYIIAAAPPFRPLKFRRSLFIIIYVRGLASKFASAINSIDAACSFKADVKLGILPVTTLAFE